MEAKAEFEKRVIEQMNRECKELTEFRRKLNRLLNEKSKDFSAVVLILTKHSTEWTSTENKLNNLLNNAFLYELLEKGHSELILEVIELLKEENTILLKEFPTQTEEYKNNLTCLTDYEKIVEGIF